MSKRQVGEVSELKVITELISLGYEVHLPCGDNCRHDILTEINSEFKKVQVKTLRSGERDGETRGGCTASDAFFDLFTDLYHPVKKIELPSYVGVDDNFYHAVRKV